MMQGVIQDALTFAAASPVLAGFLAFAITLLTRLVPGPIALVAVRLAVLRGARVARSFVAAAAAEVAVLSLAAMGNPWLAAVLASDSRLRFGLLAVVVMVGGFGLVPARS